MVVEWKNGNNIFTIDEPASFVKEETPVEISVPGNANVGTCGHNRVGGYASVFRQQGVWNAVWKVAVGRPEEDLCGARREEDGADRRR